MYEYYLDGREEGESLIKMYSFVDMVSLDFLLKISRDCLQIISTQNESYSDYEFL